MGASGVGSKVWVLTIGVLEVNPEVESISAQRGRARSALFSRVIFTCRLWRASLKQDKPVLMCMEHLSFEALQTWMTVA